MRVEGWGNGEQVSYRRVKGSKTRRQRSGRMGRLVKMMRDGDGEME